MFYLFLFLGIPSIFCYLNKETIKTSYQLYKLYKKTVDPDGNLGHFYTLKSIINIFKKYEKPLEKFNKKYLKISYKYNDKDYFYLLKIPRGIMPLRSIENEKGDNIDDILTPYLGPNLDCHGSDIYPKDFGYEKIKITTVFDRIITFEENDKIIL
jgi:hypothetical protein